VAAGPGDVTAKAPKTYRILAGPYSSQPIAPPFPAAVTTTHLKGLNVSVEYLEPEARAAFVAAALPGQQDLFAGGSIGPDPFRAFRVRIANGASEDLTLQPGNIVLVTDKGEQQFPIDLTDLYRLALHAKAADPDRMVRGVTRVMFDGSTLVRAGGTLERLIVFGAMPEKWREFRVVFSFLQIGAETHSLTFLFHRHPVAG
jgi:hypothetical protein